MKAIVWNCRGLGGVATVRSLANLARVNNPQWIGLVETKARRGRLEHVQRDLGLQNGFGVDSRGKAGEEPFRITLFYGHPITSRRGESWSLLRRLKAVSDLPWFIAEDFNEVLFGWEGTKNFGQVKTKITQVKEELAKVKEMVRTEEAIVREAELSSELDEWLLREDLFWKYRLRADWLKEGHKNTKFFHLKASQRRRINRIKRLKNSRGEWTTDEAYLCDVVIRHFEGIYSSSRPDSNGQVLRSLEIIPNRITQEMQSHLNACFSEVEIQDAVFQMCPTKPPG
ncbi:hypothetical protein QQ045_032350 [Rhodiola kirilowii]